MAEAVYLDLLDGFVRRPESIAFNQTVPDDSASNLHSFQSIDSALEAP